MMNKTILFTASRAFSHNMLKPRLIAQELMKKRVSEKDKKTYDLNVADIQVIGSESLGFSPSLLVTSGGISHLFNCSEGIQRFCYANKIKLSNLENVFITNLKWDRISGIYGLVLTMQDLGAPKIDVYTPSEIQDYFSSTKHFMSFYSGMQCTSKNCSNCGEIKDHGISIQPIVIGSNGSEKARSEDDHESQKKTKLNPVLVAYACSLPNINGPLDPKKCRELKVPIGPKLAMLKSGLDIELEDGSIVRSSQVCGPPRLGIKFIVLECPSVTQLDLFTSNQDFLNALRSDIDPDHKEVELVIHFTPHDVICNPSYRQLIELFPESCKHLFMPNIKSGLPNFLDTYRLNHLLRSFDSEIFPKLYMPQEFEEKINSEEGKPRTIDSSFIDDLEGDASIGLQEVSKPYDELERFINANNLDKLILRPRRELLSVEQPFALDLLTRDVQNEPLFQHELDSLRSLQSKLPKPKDYEPEVVFLGTGSAVPSKLRNTSNILLNFHSPKEASVILDCGEDSYGQLFRHYGSERLKEILRNLKLIYISHQHADHHIGLIKLLKARQPLTKEPVIILLPPNIESIIEFHNRNFEDLTLSYEIISTKALKTNPTISLLADNETAKLKQALYKKLNGLLENITVVPVQHCSNSCAVVMQFNIGHSDMKTFTIAYSGDARPSDDLVIAGKQCDLLIHEATFDFRHLDDAFIKKHSTSSEAIQVARRMKAKFTILTHFSQRIPKIPYFNEEFDDSIGFAFDHLELRCPTHFSRLPIMKPILSMAFKKSLGEMDLKHVKEQIKAETIKRLLQSQDNQKLK